MSVRVVSAPKTPRRLLLVAGMAVALFLVFVPAKALYGERSRIERLETRLAAVDEANGELEQETERLQDGEQLELLIRERLGWVKPGERAYLVVEDGVAPAADPPIRAQVPPPPAPEDAEPGLLSRFLRGAVSLLRGSG